MRHILIFSIACLTIAPATHAKADCSAEIGSLFKGGAWDPFARENRREVTVVRSPDGKEAASSDVKWDGPFKSINCTPNGCYMAIGVASWSGPSFDGPWKRGSNTSKVDPEVFVRGTMARLAASVREPECLGETDLGGQQTVLYRFQSKPEPNEYGSWWGGRYSVWVSQNAKRILRIELSNGIASWAPKPSKNVNVTTVTYDETIKIEEPN